MGAWSAESKTNVATMGQDDFRSNEQSVVLESDDTLRIEHVAADGTVTVLKESVPVLAGEVVDGTFMDVAALRRFLTEQIARAKADDVLFSVHLKATMMKVSDPIIFGHAVQAFFPTLFEQYGEQLAAAGISPNDGLGALLSAAAATARGRGDRGRRRAGSRRRPGDGDGRLRQGHHQPARALRRHHRRLDAGDDPARRATCGVPTARSPTPSR